MSSSSNLCLVVLIGLPAAGKTSLSIGLQKHLTGTPINCLHICFDKLVELDRSRNDFKAARNQCIDVVEQTIIKELRDHSRVTFILVDDNNYYRSMRYKFYQIARNYEISFAQILLNIDTSVAISRDVKREVKIGSTVIEKMSQRIEVPRNCVKWEENTVNVQIDCINYNEIVHFLQQSLNFPVKQNKQEKIVTQSQVHKLDLVLRKLVGEFLSKTTDKRIQAQILNEKRRILLQDIKHGIIPTEITECELRNLLFS